MERKKILRIIVAIGLYALAFTILKDSFLRELIAIFLVIVGVNIQRY